MKSQEHGTKLKKEYIEACKVELISIVSSWYSVEDQPGSKDLIPFLTERSGGKKVRSFNIDFKQSIEFLIDRIKQAVDFREFFEISTQLLEHQNFWTSFNGNKMHLTCTIPTEVALEFVDATEAIMRRDFYRHYESLWEGTLKSRTEQAWYKLLEIQSDRISNQKDTFKFYWTIFKGFSNTYINPDELQFELSQKDRLKAVLHHFEKDIIRSASIEEIKNKTSLTNSRTDIQRNDIQNWLLQKCMSFRIKIRMNCTERELIELIKRTWITSKLWDGSLIQIDSVENFVRTHFTCKDSRHETKFYKHSFKVPVASEFIHFIRYLFHCEKLFDLKYEREVKLMEMDKLIEVQLWLEFVFRGHPGFSESSIEAFFVNNENQGRDLTDFSYIKSKYPSGFEGYLSAFNMKYRKNPIKVKSDLN